MISNIWNKFKKNKRDNSISYSLPFYTDIHSHLIPGIDDGVKTIEESLSILKYLSKLKYKRVITTPHIMYDSYNNTSQNILNALEELKREVKKNNIEIELFASAEYYMDEGFIKHLKNRDILTIGDNYLLFETSYYSKPLNLEDIIYEIKANGYKPIMAHPERYRYIKEPDKFYKKLKDLEVYLQVNINSFIGKYGIDAQKKAIFLMENGSIDFLGSDIHNISQAQSIKEAIDSGILDKIVKNNFIKNDNLL